MLGVAGFRQYKVIVGAVGTLGTQYAYIEVTNDTGADVLLYLNDFPEGGHPATDGIPIKAGTTRPIPVTCYNFVASGTVTVVAYGM